jgi:hypothetical protein
MALLAALVEQIMHEGVHAIAALLVGAKVDAFHFWAVAHSFASPPVNNLAEGVIAASAALVDLTLAALCIALIMRTVLPATLRLFLFYLAAICLFSGFGYLLVDPIFAGPESAGDWAKVVMLLGGEWSVRIPIILVGAAGTIVGFFWFGRNAMLIEIPGRTRNQRGFISCIVPYLLVCTVFSVMALWHPVGIPGTVAVLMKCWMGYIGFFWGYMIIFVWDDYQPPQDRIIPVADSLNAGMVLILSAGLVASVLWVMAPLPPGLH